MVALHSLRLPLLSRAEEKIMKTNLTRRYKLLKNFFANISSPPRRAIIKHSLLVSAVHINCICVQRRFFLLRRRP